MELSKNQKYFLYENLGSEFAMLRKNSSFTKENVAKYSNLGLSQLESMEKGCPGFGNLKLYIIMSWAGVFGKKLKITLEDLSERDKVEAYEQAQKKLNELNRLLF